jgi:hypothetical protein
MREELIQSILERYERLLIDIKSKSGLRPIATSDTEITIPESPKNDHV